MYCKKDERNLKFNRCMNCRVQFVSRLWIGIQRRSKLCYFFGKFSFQSRSFVFQQTSIAWCQILDDRQQFEFQHREDDDDRDDHGGDGIDCRSSLR